MSSFVHIHMKKGEGIDQAAVLHMGPKENGAIADQEHKEHHIGLRDRDQKADQEDHIPDHNNDHTVAAERTSRRRTRSGSREKERRKGRDKEKAREKERSRGKEKEQHYNKSGDAGNIKTGLEHLSAAEQAKARLQLVLEAAAKADEALKAKERSEEEAKKKKEDQASLVEQVKRVKEIEAIESDSFIQQTFRSSKEVKKVTESADIKSELGITEVTNVGITVTEKEVKTRIIPTTIKYQDENSLAHPNLFIDKAEAEERWFQRLMSLRQERLMGSPVA
uniref:Serine/Arginine-related protein 53 n=1 Tax=Micrurus paraensis TaxID=1970185 RepID=A0A2D4KPB0_9SAUR